MPQAQESQQRPKEKRRREPRVCAQFGAGFMAQVRQTGTPRLQVAALFTQYQEDEMVTNTGGPAFPGPLSLSSGLSVRDYFAGHALTGLLVQGALAVAPLGTLQRKVAEASYGYADAMLAAREWAPHEQPALSASESLLHAQLRTATDALRDEAELLEQWAEREREDEWRRFVERADALRRLVATLERTLGGGR